MNIRELYRQVVQRLEAAGISDAEIEAGQLLGHLCKMSRARLFLAFEQEVPAAVLQRCQTLLTRREQREPLAYILGEQEFWSLSFQVTPDVLIPRPETELLLEAALEELQPREAAISSRVFDLGTGSGIIPVVLALELPRAVIYSLDRSLAALGVASRNARRHGVAHRIQFIASDWLSGIRPRPFFDAVLSNPPYIARHAFPSLQPEVQKFEPLLALDGGPAGFEIVHALISEAAFVLKPQGWLFMEIGYDQEEQALATLQANRMYEHPVVRKDYAGHPRILQARKRK